MRGTVSAEGRLQEPGELHIQTNPLAAAISHALGRALWCTHAMKQQPEHLAIAVWHMLCLAAQRSYHITCRGNSM